MRTVKKENDGINGNKEYHLIAAKKVPFDTISIMDIVYRYDEKVVPHPNLSNLLDIC